MLPLDPEESLFLRMVNTESRDNIPNPKTLDVARIERLPNHSKMMFVDLMFSNGASHIKNMMHAAAKRGCNLLCMFLVKHFYINGPLEFEPSMFVSAASGGNIFMLYNLNFRRLPKDDKAFLAAALEGHNEAMLAMMNMNFPVSRDTVDKVIEAHCLSSIIWMNQKGMISEYKKGEVVHVAARSGDLPILEYFRHQGFPFMGAALGAIQSGDVSVMEYVWQESDRFDTTLLVMSVVYGHVPIMEFLADRGGINFTRDAYYFAALNANIHAMEFLLQRGTPWDSRTWNHTKMCANPEPVLEWLERHGCPQK
jgi:hypothetical protein